MIALLYTDNSGVILIDAMRFSTHSTLGRRFVDVHHRRKVCYEVFSSRQPRTLVTASRRVCGN